MGHFVIKGEITFLGFKDLLQLQLYCSLVHYCLASFDIQACFI